MDYVKTSTEKKFNVVHCGSMNAILYVTLVGYGMLDVVTIFSNPNETNVIEYYREGNSLVASYEGFTVLTDVSQLDDQIRIALKNPSLE